MKLADLVIPSLILTSLITTTTHASPFQGFYFNLGLGATQQTGSHPNKNWANVDGGGGTVINIALNNKLQSYDHSTLGEIGAGYSRANNNQFAGGELDLSFHSKLYSTAKEDLMSTVNGAVNTAILTNTKVVSSNLDLALLLKAGWFTNNVAFYGLLGPKFTHFKTTSNSTYMGDFGGGPFMANGTDSNSKLKTGIAFGAGIESYFRKNLTYGIKYTHTIYKNLPKTSFTVPITGGAAGNFISENKATLHSNNLLFNVAYYL